MTYALHHLTQTAALTLQHVELVAAGLLLSLVIAIPLGVLSARKPWLDTPIFGIAGVIYTIPSLALLALAVQYIGLGFWTLVLVLAAYAQFILVRATATALRTVPRAQLDAANGLGMSGFQRFLRVEVPLSMPVFLGGVRLATVALIAIATLGGYVGAGGLGNDIFFGLQRQYPAQTLTGSVPAALLAIVADVMFRLFERRWTVRVRS
jgi:osmoprotectant transport system permease protein